MNQPDAPPIPAAFDNVLPFQAFLVGIIASEASGGDD